MDILAMRDGAAELTRQFAQNWKRFLAVHVTVTLLVITLLAPLSSLLLRLAVSLSGSAALSDQDILFFILSPQGFVSALLLGSVFSIMVFLGHGALLVMAGFVSEGKTATVRDVLMILAGRAADLLVLAILVLVRVLLNLLPFVLLLLLIYKALLSDFDINYYLAENPAEWWLAIALGAVVGVACALNLLRLFINWVFCLPLLILGDRSPRQALADSSKAASGYRREIGAWLVFWLVASSLLTAVVSFVITLAGMYLIPGAAESLESLVVALSVVSLVSVVFYFGISFVSSSWLSLLIIRLLKARGLVLDGQFRARDGASQQGLPRASRRMIVGALLVGLAIAAFSSWLLIQRLQFETAAEVLAHRGASAAAPENTIAAIRGAIDAGAQWVEIDVQESADGQIVVIHDSDLKKIGGSAMTVAGSTLQQLQQVDIGSWFAPEFSDQRVPTLEEVLQLCKDRINVIIELKYYGKQVKLEERVAQVVERAGMTGQVMFMSLSYDGIQALRALRPGWKVGLLSSVAIGNLADLEVDFLALNGRAATRNMIRQAHKNEKQVMVWTVNDAVAIASMIGRGADGLITDEPALAAEVLQRYRQLEPSRRLLLQLADFFDRPGLYAEQ
jgi:glycerophosphoryl diester phosphodiesterase